MGVMMLVVLLSAGPEARWGLRWNAPDGCMQAAEAARRVEERFGRPVFTANPEYRIDAVVDAPPAGGYRARLTLVSAQGDVLGTREVTAPGTCRQLDEQVAVAMAVMIDPGLAPGQQAPPPAQPPPLRERPHGEGDVFVHLEADQPQVRLIRLGGTLSAGNASLRFFADECQAPCDAFIARPHDQFYVEAPEMASSEAFTLAGHSAATVVVHGVKRGPFAAGVGLVAGGGLAFVVGAATMLTGLGDAAGMGVGLDVYAQRKPAVLVIAGVGGGVGAALIIAGIVLLARPGTAVEVKDVVVPEKVLPAVAALAAGVPLRF